MAEKIRNYESICLTKVDMAEDKFKAMLDKCMAAVKTEGKGEWELQDDWGKAKIAYPIQKQARAQWTYFKYSSTPTGVQELTRNLKLNEDVLRVLTTRVEDEGSSYQSVKATMKKDLTDREKAREWKDYKKKRPPYAKGGYKSRDYGDKSHASDGDVVAPSVRSTVAPVAKAEAPKAPAKEEGSN